LETLLQKAKAMVDVASGGNSRHCSQFRFRGASEPACSQSAAALDQAKGNEAVSAWAACGVAFHAMAMVSGSVVRAPRVVHERWRRSRGAEFADQSHLTSIFRRENGVDSQPVPRRAPLNPTDIRKSRGDDIVARIS
jgi:hypothetical protein